MKGIGATLRNLREFRNIRFTIGLRSVDNAPARNEREASAAELAELFPNPVAISSLVIYTDINICPYVR